MYLGQVCKRMQPLVANKFPFVRTFRSVAARSRPGARAVHAQTQKSPDSFNCQGSFAMMICLELP